MRGISAAAAADNRPTHSLADRPTHTHTHTHTPTNTLAGSLSLSGRASSKVYHRSWSEATDDGRAYVILRS